jgi:hypothetical protein
MRLPGIALILALTVGWALGSGARAAQPQTGVQPSALPLLTGLDMRYLGTVALPEKDQNEVPLIYGGHALGIAADGQSLYYSCVHATGLARVTIPEAGGKAEILEPCRGIPNLGALDPDDPNAKRLGGLLAWNGRLVLTGFAVYDAGRVVSKSHWVGTTLAEAQGPYEVGNELPGLVAGYMGVVPEEWRALFGGPALTGQCCISIISRSSYGPSVSVFDPDQVGGRKKAPAKMLVGYPDEHQGLGPYDYPGQFWSSVVLIGGVAFPSGTRSVLFIGRHGTGYCYGEGTKDPALHAKPHPAGTLWCHDPTNADKGSHGFPYRHMVWAYDANDLVAVKQGKKDPWNLRPYAVWPLTEMNGGNGDAWMNGAVYHPGRRRLYVVPKNDAVLHVYEVRTGSS